MPGLIGQVAHPALRQAGPMSGRGRISDWRSAWPRVVKLIAARSASCSWDRPLLAPEPPQPCPVCTVVRDRPAWVGAAWASWIPRFLSWPHLLCYGTDPRRLRSAPRRRPGSSRARYCGWSMQSEANNLGLAVRQGACGDPGVEQGRRGLPGQVGVRQQPRPPVRGQPCPGRRRSGRCRVAARYRALRRPDTLGGLPATPGGIHPRHMGDHDVATGKPASA